MTLDQLKPKLFEYLRKNNFKRIADAIELTWGSTECDAYLSKLIFSEDRENRQGFPPNIFQVILKLYNMHSDECKTDKLSVSKNSNDWTFK